MRHAEWRKNFLPCEQVELQAGLTGQHLSKQNEADVAVRSARARVRQQAGGECRPNQFVARAGKFEELFVGWQATGVG